MTPGYMEDAEDKMKRLIERVGESPRPTEDQWDEFAGRARRSLAIHRVYVGAAAAVVVALIAFGANALLGRDGGGAIDQPAGSRTGTEGGVVAEATATPVRGPIHLQVWFVDDEQLFLTHREVPYTQRVGRAAMEELLAGPAADAPESDGQLQTAIPAGTELQDIVIDQETGVATVTMAGDHPDDSDTQQDLAYGQIVHTLEQFDTVKSVAMEWESPEEGGIGTGGHKASEYEHLLPPIVVESPYAGETISNGGRFHGTANVFEATVSWRLVAADGYVMAEGFTTATCGTGCRGRFTQRLDYEVTEDMQGYLEVYESSAEDGSELHLVRVPVSIVASVPAGGDATNTN